MTARIPLLVSLLTLVACSDVSVIDLQASACLRLEECVPESFDALYTSQQACVDAYDDTTSVCYDLHCTYDPTAAPDCQADIEAQSCADLAAGVEMDTCRPEALWTDCDDTAVTDCIAELEAAR